MLKKKYSELQKKYNLPDYNLINQEFDIEDINEESDLILQKIRLKIYEKIAFYSEMFENILQPESSLADLYEAHYIEESTKNSAYSIYKKLIKILRKSSLVSLNNSEQENAKFIIESYNEWNNLKSEIEKHLKRRLTLWEKETDIREDLSYFG
ncbi:MAG: hypothetical protein QXE31_03285 [Candidatus Woesearchaeota archaeon]